LVDQALQVALDQRADGIAQHLGLVGELPCGREPVIQ
jgi:hypothetical protein